MSTRGGGGRRRHSLPIQARELDAKARLRIAEAKAYGVRAISKEDPILTGRNMQELNRQSHEVRYFPRLCLPARRL